MWGEGAGEGATKGAGVERVRRGGIYGEEGDWAHQVMVVGAREGDVKIMAVVVAVVVGVVMAECGQTIRDRQRTKTQRRGQDRQ